MDVRLIIPRRLRALVALTLGPRVPRHPRLMARL